MLEIVLEKVRRDYGEASVVKNVSCKIREGKLTCLVGPSGSGKTTLLNLISGIENVSGGRIVLKDKKSFEISAMTDKSLRQLRTRLFGFVFQSSNLFPYLTVEENMVFPTLFSEEKINVSPLLEKLGIAGFAQRYPPQLSGGERQRVSVARALVAGHRIILADEPTAELDTENAFMIMNLLRSLVKNRIVVVATHDLRLLEYADVVLELQDGELVRVEEK